MYTDLLMFFLTFSLHSLLIYLFLVNILASNMFKAAVQFYPPSIHMLEDEITRYVPKCNNFEIFLI